MATAQRNPSFDKFLSGRRAGRGTQHTHTRIRNAEARVAGGSYAVDSSDDKQFLELYYQKVFGKKTVDHMTEKQLVDDGPLLVDIDLRYEPSVDKRKHSSDHVEDVVAGYMSVLDDLLDVPDGTHIPVTVMHKPEVNRLADKTKDGIHIIFGVKTPRAVNLMIRKRMLKEIACMWEDLPITNTWDDVLDEGVAKGSVNWQLYGSCKPGHSAYLATNHYIAGRESGAWTLEETSMSEFDTQKMLPKLSARCHTHEGFPLKSEHRKEFEDLTLPVRPTKTVQRATRYDSIRSQKELDEALEAMFEDISATDYRLKETHEYAMILPSDYYGPGSYNRWIRVGWALHNTSPKLFFSWLKFSSQPGCRGTLRGADGSFDWGKVSELFEMWRDFGGARPDGLTYKSILYWAKQDAGEKYEKVREQTIDFFIEVTMGTHGFGDGLEYDMANVLYNIYKDRFVCVSIKNNVWYEYRKHRWHESDSGTALRRFISTEMHQLYVQKVIECTRQMDQMDQANDDWDKSRKRTKKLCDIADLLKRTAFKKNIMTEAKELFFDKNFHAKLDQNPYIMCFSNGIVDFKKKIHRKGLPDDYVSKCTNIDYVPLNDIRGNKQHTEVEKFMQELFPNASLRSYMYQHLASCLLGTNQNQTFNIYRGGGSNGKSKLVEFMSKVLGEYKGTVPFALLTQKRSSIGSTSSEIVQLMGIRYAVMQEPSKGDKVNEGIMKEITGGDPIQGRALFKDTVTFVPQFKLVVCTNVDIEFMSNDDGTWRRIRVCDFQAKFLDRPYEEPEKYPPSENPHQYKIDKTLDEKLGSWAPVMASILADIAFDRQGEVGDCPEVLSSSDKYRERQDYMAEFAKDRIMRMEGERVTKSELVEDFRKWYKETCGPNPPPGREVTEFVTKKYGAPRSGTWRNIMMINDQEDDADALEANPGTGSTQI